MITGESGPIQSCTQIKMLSSVEKIISLPYHLSDLSMYLCFASCVTGIESLSKFYWPRRDLSLVYHSFKLAACFQCKSFFISYRIICWKI